MPFADVKCRNKFRSFIERYENRFDKAEAVLKEGLALEPATEYDPKMLYILGREYLRSIARTANEVIPRVVDYLVTLPEIDPGRIGMTGSSTNGFITLQAVAADGRLSAAVAAAACGDHLRFLRFSSMGMAGQPLQLDPEYERWLHGQEPIRHPERLVHAALLVVNRVDDPLVPISCAESTAHVLERAYARAGVPERFRFVRTQESGHGVGKAEGEEALAWLRRWLLEPRR